MTERIHAAVFLDVETDSDAIEFGIYQQAKSTASRPGGPVGGWVMDPHGDGSIDAVFEGSKEAVEALVDWCRERHRDGRLDYFEVSYGEPSGLDEFEIK